MAKRLQVNKKKWTNKSNISYRSYITGQKGHIYWKDEKIDGKIQYMWKGHKFLAKDLSEAHEYVFHFKEIITDF